VSTETRTIRPYHGVEIFQELLDKTRLRLGERLILGASRTSLSIDEYLNHPLSLVFHDGTDDATRPINAALSEVGLERRDVELVVLSSSPRLKLVDTIYCKRLDEIDAVPAEVAFPRPRPRAMQGTFGGCDVRAYFCLARQFPPQTLHPWRKGTWLGKQEFLLRTDLAGVGFMPVKLTDEIRLDVGLDPDVTRYAQIDPEVSVFDREVPADAVLVYIDETVLDRIAVTAHTATGKHFQRQLFIEAAWAVATRAGQEIHDDPALQGASIDDFAGSLVHGLVVMLVGGSSDDESEARRHNRYRELISNPSRFMSNLEARLTSRRDVLGLLGD